MEGADEIGLAVVATTVTIVAVFAAGRLHAAASPGQFFKEFGLTVCVAVLFSLLVARLLTPLMAAYLLKPTPRSRARTGRWMAPTCGALDWALDHRLADAGIGAGRSSSARCR